MTGAKRAREDKMSQHYSNPERESETHALPDIEVWEDEISTIYCSLCGETDQPYEFWLNGETIHCPQCGRIATHARNDGSGWWFWHCFPGCLPDSEVYGPFSSESEALEAARAD